MLYNRLISNDRRRSYGLDFNTAFPEQRHRGRSTAIALAAVAKAINNPQQWIEVVDHGGLAVPQIRHVDLAHRAMVIAGALNLVYFERDRNLIRSCHMTPNQLELK